jgi:hypothetical protein
MLMPETTANIWLKTKPIATSQLDGRNHLTRRTSKSKNKSKNAAKEKTSAAYRLPRPRQQDFPAPEFLKSPKNKNNLSLDKRRFHT